MKEKLKERTNKLSNDILALLDEYQKETGFSASKIEPVYIQSNVDHSHPDKIINVKISVEL